MKSVTQNDVAREVGVSQQSVGYALGHYRAKTRMRLRPETRQRILDAAQRLGYVPHQAARSLKSQRTSTVVIATCDELHHAHFHELAEELHATLDPQGYRVVLELLHRTGHRSRKLHTLTAANADAAILLVNSPPVLQEVLRDWHQRLPLVLIGPYDGTALTCVTYDRAKAVTIGVVHLLKQGHRQVALVYDKTDDLPSRLRVQGYQAAHVQTGVSPHESLLVPWATDGDASALCTRLLSLTPRPSGVYCYNDELALRLLQSLHRAGINVPQELAIVTQGNTRLTTLDEVPMTAVDTNNAGIAHAAVKLLLELIGNPQTAPRQVLVEPHLVVRASSGKTNS